MRDKTLLHISVPVVKDCRNPGESWNHMCTYCNKCGRWDAEEKREEDLKA